jgi:hypothetical protein
MGKVILKNIADEALSNDFSKKVMPMTPSAMIFLK